MVRIAIIDYGIGNLRSIKRSLEKAGSKVIITRKKEEIVETDAIVLPGVGAFEAAIKNLEPISEVLLTQIHEKKPILGICLGLQILFTVSTEGGYHKGLDVFKGSIVRFPPNMKVPHIGWNTLKDFKPNNALLKAIPDGTYVYFVHSYYADTKCGENVISKTHYGLDFPSAVSKDKIFATQFHPEKSGEMGLKILKNFVEFVKS